MTEDERLVFLTPLLRACSAPGPGEPVRAVLAVSGGPDSLAMLALIGQARPALADAGFQFSVATVDHGLRPAGAAEAARVAAVSRDCGLDHATLLWRGWAGTGNLQALAREARYALLVEEARERRASAIVTAHTLDDQVETFLMAKMRGAVGAGLAGMRASRDLAPGICLLRPFLHLRKADLAAVLPPRGLVASHDPSNDDPRFARVQARIEAARLTQRERHDILRALETARGNRVAGDEALLDAIRSSPRGASGGGDALGRLFHDHHHFGSLEPDVATRLVARAVTAAGGAAYPPPSAAAARLRGELCAAHDGFAATLNGCQIRRVGERLVFSREYGRSGPPPASVEGVRLVFDRRFDISMSGTDRDGGGQVVPFGRSGHGNASERTLPVLVAGTGSIVRAHEAIAGKAGSKLPSLSAVSRVEWRFLADLRDGKGRPRSPRIATVDPAEPGTPCRLAFGTDHRR